MIAAVVVSFLLAQTLPSEPSSAGEQQFARMCSVCHGGDGTGTDRGPALTENRRLRARGEPYIREIIKNGAQGMPAFPLPEHELTALARYVRSFNATAFDLKPAGDVAAGERFFFGKGQCGSCHTVRGRGGANGPDLSDIAKQTTFAELRRSLREPSAHIADGWQVVTAQLTDGSPLRGYARGQGHHSLQLQTFDGRMHLLIDRQYRSFTPEKASAMPPLKATAEEERDLLAFLSQLDGITPGPLKHSVPAVDSASIDRILRPVRGEWPTYNGDVRGNRHSPLDQINTTTVLHLKPAWSYSIPYFGLETTPIVINGMMFVTGPNQVYALDARTGNEIWRYHRPRTPARTISADAALGVNRGVAVLGDRVFYTTDDAHLICLHRLTGGLLWDVFMPLEQQRYGTTAAPLVAGDLVISGVGGADDGIRGFLAAYKATTGELTWRFWVVPKPGEPGSETWQGKAITLGGGSTWTTGSYDPETGVLYWATGNPYPDTDGDERKGDNLYTNCDLALDAKTGKLLWHFQFTPHDLHDWDANQPIVLIDSMFRGRQRKLLLHANRNGFYYVLDRTNGEMLLAKQFVKRLTWASGIGPDGRPQLLPGNEPTTKGVVTCPAVRGATNWYSTAFNPDTGFYYVMSVEDCSLYRKAQDGGFGRVKDPANPPLNYLRALKMETGELAWEILLPGPVGSTSYSLTEGNYSGVLSTGGGLVFFGETSGGFAAIDAKSGRHLWHYEANQPWKGSPMTYMVDGKQYVAVASGATIFSFSLP